MLSNPHSRRQICLVLISIILATIPCYCIGLFAASLAPDRGLAAYRNTDPYCYNNTNTDNDPLPQPDPVRQCSACFWNTYVDSHTLPDTYANPDSNCHSDSITHLHSLSHTVCLCYIYIPSPTGTLNADSDGTTAGRECWHAIPVIVISTLLEYHENG